jgi:hypothetical protein
MDGTLTYPRNSERRFLPRLASGMRLLFTLADCRAEEEQIQVGNVTEYAKLIGQSAGSFLSVSGKSNSAVGSITTCHIWTTR